MSDYWKEYWRSRQTTPGLANKLIQVERTLNGKPIEESEVQLIQKLAAEYLDLSPNDVLLDLCCGNGLLTIFLLPHVKKITAVDFSKPLTEALQNELTQLQDRRCFVINTDATQIEFEEASFSKIVMAAALQHFSEGETVILLKKMQSWLQPGGVMLITDIPDQSRIWSFHNTRERAAAYFDGLATGRQIIGTWFHPDWLRQLASHVGFSIAEIRMQPPGRTCNHYRFDLLCRK